MRLSKFLGDARGNIVIAFAVMAPAFLAAGGIAIDYSTASSLKSTLQSASDAAALTAARAYQNNGAKKSDAEKAGLDALAANFAGGGKAGAAGFAGSVTMTKADPPTFSAQAKAELVSRFSPFVSQGNLKVAAAATAQIGLNPNENTAETPTDLIIAMDVSASMGIAATIADRNKLAAAVNDDIAKYGGPAEAKECAFACHGQNWSPSGPKTTLDLARQNNVLLRFDVQRNVIMSAVDNLLGNGNKNDHRIGIMALSTSVSTVANVSANRGGIVSSLASVDFQIAGTLYEVTFPEVAKQIADMIASKKLRASANKSLLIITDGMRTIPWANDTLDIYAIKSSSCDAFKKLGVNVAVLELKYLPEPIMNHYNYPYFSTQLPLISPTLKSCASSPDLYALAAEADDIIKQFDRVVKNAVSAAANTPRLVQ